MTITKNVGPAKVWAAPTMQVVSASAARSETGMGIADGSAPFQFGS